MSISGVHLNTTSSAVTVLIQIHESNGELIDTCSAIPIPNILFKEYVYYGLIVSQYGEILIVGTTDTTIVTLSSVQSIKLKVGNDNVQLTPGSSYSFVLNKLQTMLIGSPNNFRIVTNKPVSVFIGRVCISELKDSKICDQILVQVPPTILWGTDYCAASLTIGNPYANYTIKVLAAHDSTDVVIYCNNTKSSYTINKGIAIVKTIRNKIYCVILATKQILVAQIIQNGSNNINVAVMLLPSMDQYSNKLITSTARKPLESGYKHFVNIIVLTESYQPNMIYLISGGVNKSLNTESWKNFRVLHHNDAYATTIPISEGPVEIVHTDPLAFMMALVYGFADTIKYSHSVGFMRRMDKFEG